MAVRIFDLTEPQSSRLTVLELAPLRRRDLRRARQRWSMVALISLLTPFVAALVVLGVAH
jgi:hypothetical protein